MAIASGPACPVLAGPVFMVILGTEHAQIMNNDRAALTTSHRHARIYATRTFYTHMHTAIAGTPTLPRTQQLAVSPIPLHRMTRPVN